MTAEPSQTPQRSAKSVVFYGIFRGLSLLPLWLVQALAWVFVIPFLLIPSRHRRATWVNLRLCFPELSRVRHFGWFVRSLVESVRGILEMGHFWYRPRSVVLGLVKEVVGGELLEEALASEDPVLIGAPHFGAWELLCLYLSTRRQSTFIYREPRDPAFEALIRNSRERFGAHLVRANAHGVRSLIRHGRRGDLIGMMPDHQPRRGDGVYAPFFGYGAYTMTLFSKLANKEHARVLIGCAERLPWGRGFRLRFVEPEKEIRGDDLLVSATALNRTIEKMVRRQPLQYEWTYKRYSMRPGGLDYHYDHLNLPRFESAQTEAGED